MKSKKVYGLMAAVILSLAVVGTLEAQTAPAGLISSPTRSSTASRYRTASDDFIRPGDYAGVKFDKFFGFASWAATNKAVLGYAQKFGDTYLGVYYGGTLWGGATVLNYTEVEANPFSTGFKTFLSYTTAPAFTTNPDNRIAVLLGVADMGFRLSLASTHQSFKKSDIRVTTGGPTYYKSYQTDYGVIAPQLSWSMAKNLSANGIKPYVDLNLNFYRNYIKFETYTTTGTTIGEQIGASQNSFRPGLAAGLGGYTFYKQGGFSAGFDLDYTLGLTLYDNEYSYTDAGSYKIKKFKGYYVTGATSYYLETSTVANNLTPSLSAGWSGGNLGLKAKLNLGLNLNVTNATQNNLTAANELQKNGNDYTSTYFTFAPNLQLAMQYKLVPNKLTINAGSVIGNAGIGSTTEKGSVYAAGTQTPGSSYKAVTNTVSATTASFLLGASLNFTDNVMLDASTGVANGATGAGNGLNVFDSSATGLFHFGSLLVSLKF
ncbi:MAG: hypothetical protein LBD48_12705 [Treponema sp.]|nr:hypothetical protein [Treponema sp.]